METKKYIEEGTSFLTVKNDIGFEVTLSKLGGAIYSIRLNGKQMTLSPEIKQWVRPNMYHGKTIGRVGNRIRGNKVLCEGKEYVIENNEGPNTLHGGVHGISTQTFNEEIKETKDYIEVTYSYNSPEGESGFPAELNIKSIYKIYNKEAKLELDLIANTNKESLCALTNHAYFMVGDEDETTLKLTIKGRKYIVPNKDDLLGECIAEVPEYLDFSKGRMITKDIKLPVLLDSKTRGYDHHFFFEKVTLDEPQIILEGNKYIMEIYTDYSGAQLYSDNVKDGIKYLGTDKEIYRGCALEPQESHFVLHYLKPNETYHHKIIYVFEEK